MRTLALSGRLAAAALIVVLGLLLRAEHEDAVAVFGSRENGHPT